MKNEKIENKTDVIDAYNPAKVRFTTFTSF